jgi:dienelactone hydrolase
MRRRLFLVLLVVAIALLWRPFLRPLGAGAILVADIYSSALWDRNVAAYVTPAPRVEDGTERIGSVDMRVTWWIPGWGTLHPAVMLVNGATEKGNDDSETRRLGEALARAGYLVMLPEFPFIKAGRLERDATSILDAAFARALARPETKGMAVGAFGFSVGGGMLLAAASGRGALSGASYIGALGAYFDLDTYLASVLSLTQRRPAGSLEPWDADAEVRLRLPVAAAEALEDASDRERITAELRATGGRLSGQPPSGLGTEGAALWRALTATDYDIALERLHLLPASLREVFDSLSPRTTWSSLRPAVFWLHDVGDRFEPVSEAETASATPHAGPTRFQRTALLSHAAALGTGAKEKGLDFWAPELSGLLLFAASALGAGE